MRFTVYDNTRQWEFSKIYIGGTFSSLRNYWDVNANLRRHMVINEKLYIIFSVKRERCESRSFKSLYFKIDFVFFVFKTMYLFSLWRYRIGSIVWGGGWVKGVFMIKMLVHLWIYIKNSCSFMIRANCEIIVRSTCKLIFLGVEIR